MLSRRAIVRGAIVAALQTAGRARRVSATAASGNKPDSVAPRLGFQLYSSRKFPPLEDQLSFLSSSGYSIIEYSVDDLPDVGEQLRLQQKHALASPTGHFSAGSLGNLPLNISSAQRLGIKVLVVPWLAEPARPGDIAGWTKLRSELQATARTLSDYGLRLAWHNHDYEFMPLADRSLPIEHLFRNAPSLGWEPDVGWMERARVDVASWLRSFGDRIVAVHLKDVAADGQNLDEDGWADVGYGRVDWSAIVPILQMVSPVAYIVEHDNPTDYKRFARRSRDTLLAW